MTTQLITINELGEWLRMTPAAIRQARYRNETSIPPAIRIGRHLRWDPAAVSSWLAQQTETNGTPSSVVNGAPRTATIPAGADHA